MIAGALHTAVSPSAQREKRAQQPSAAQAQLRPSTNTEWQSGRASHASFVVTCAHGAGQAIAGQRLGGSSGAAQRMNALPPLQPGQVSTRQSVRALHDASSSPEHGAGHATPMQAGGDSVAPDRNS